MRRKKNIELQMDENHEKQDVKTFIIHIDEGNKKKKREVEVVVVPFK